ncbi:MAG: isoprenylcysteine carboxylmethyltransferase family protein [Salinibacter sp.]
MNEPDRSVREAFDDEPPPGEILAPSPLLTLGAFLVGLGIDQVIPLGVLPWPWNLPLGCVLVVGGGLLFADALRTMRAHDKHPSHADEPPELITEGVYQYSRNPIYVGHSIAHVGASLLLNTLWPIVTLLPLLGYLRRVVRQEEARLEALFGQEYERYREEVRRWL